MLWEDWGGDAPWWWYWVEMEASTVFRSLTVSCTGRLVSGARAEGEGTPLGPVEYTLLPTLGYTGESRMDIYGKMALVLEATVVVSLSEVPAPLLSNLPEGRGHGPVAC